MKRFISLLLAVLTAATLVACGTATVDAKGLAKALAERVQFDSTVSPMSIEEIGFYLSETMPDGLPADSVASAYMSDADTTEEIFAIACKNKTDADAVKVALQALLNSQMSQAKNYQPEEVARLNNAIFATYGTCVVLCVTNDTATANAVIKEYVG